MPLDSITVDWADGDSFSLHNISTFLRRLLLGLLLVKYGCGMVCTTLSSMSGYFDKVVCLKKGSEHGFNLSIICKLVNCLFASFCYGAGISAVSCTEWM